MKILLALTSSDPGLILSSTFETYFFLLYGKFLMFEHFFCIGCVAKDHGWPFHIFKNVIIRLRGLWSWEMKRRARSLTLFLNITLSLMVTEYNKTSQMSQGPNFNKISFFFPWSANHFGGHYHLLPLFIKKFQASPTAISHFLGVWNIASPLADISINEQQKSYFLRG